MKGSKRIVITVSIISSVMLLCGLLVYAYFSYMTSRENEIAVADNTIQISEQFEPPDQQTTGENVFKKKS